MASAFPESQPVLPHHQNVIQLQNEALGSFTYPEMDFLKTEPGKTDYSSASSFRPICLTSFVFKCMERCLHWEISENALKDNPPE